MVFPKGLLLVHLSVFADSFGYAFIMPIIPFFATKLGGTAFELGLTVGSYALFQALSNVIMGTLSDIYGRRIMLLLSLFGSFSGPLFQSFSWCMWAFIVFRGYTGLLGGSQTIGQAYIADVTSIEDRPKYMSQQAAVISSAFVFGPAIGGFLSNYLLESPFWLASVCALVVFVISIFSLKETNQKIIKKNELQKQKKDILKKKRLNEEDHQKINKIDKTIQKLMEKPTKKSESEKIHWNARMVIMVIAKFFTDAITMMLDSMMGLYMIDNFGATALDISGVQCMTGILMLLIQIFVVPPLVKYLSLRYLTIIAAFITLIGTTYMAYSYDLLSSYLSVAIMFTGYSLIYPLIPTVLSTEAPKESQGTVLSIGTLSGQIAQICIPSLAGLIYEYSHFWSMMCGTICEDKRNLQNKEEDSKIKKDDIHIGNKEKESISESSSVSTVPSSAIIVTPLETQTVSSSNTIPIINNC
ncbi:hypothetical protein WA158_000051 [Blastocystis sp. Blastoise]